MNLIYQNIMKQYFQNTSKQFFFNYKIKDMFIRNFMPLSEFYEV